jgi:transposase InsO family protein
MSRFMWAILLLSKDATMDAIKQVQAMAEKESGHELRVLRTDNDDEFIVTEFLASYADEGIQRHFSVPYSPQQNDIVEHRNQTMVGTARSLLKQRCRPSIGGRR